MAHIEVVVLVAKQTGEPDRSDGGGKAVGLEGGVVHFLGAVGILPGGFLVAGHPKNGGAVVFNVVGCQIGFLVAALFRACIACLEDGEEVVDNLF